MAIDTDLERSSAYLTNIVGSGGDGVTMKSDAIPRDVDFDFSFEDISANQFDVQSDNHI